MTDETEADAGPRVAESSALDLSTDTLEQESIEPDDAIERGSVDDPMDAMMSGSWGMATRDASTPITIAPLVAAERELRESDTEMAAIMGTGVPEPIVSDPIRREPIRPVSVAKLPTVIVTQPSEPEHTADSLGRPIATPAIDPVRESTEVLVEPPSSRPKTGPLGVVRPAAIATPRRMPSPEPRRTNSSRASEIELGARPKRLSLGWAVVAGVGIAGIAWAIGGPIGGPRSPSPPPAIAEASSVAPGDPVAATPTPAPTTSSTAREPIAAPVERSTKPEAKPDVVVTPEPIAPPKPIASPEPARPTRPGGVRTPPPGTPPDIAATFVRLPVSVADLPPVGGVGASGIHVDRIEMGAGYDNKTGCTGVAKDFSVAANDEINVCLRVVHPREEEVMSIVWQMKDTATARRGKIAVKPIHAYRTRAYLRLRAEYVGAWTVRIMSSDGVELASHAFTITP